MGTGRSKLYRTVYIAVKEKSGRGEISMGRRGGELRDHILKAAKDVFLELGYERA